jgi:spermidine synthase
LKWFNTAQSDMQSSSKHIPPQVISNSLRRFLYLTAGVTGASILIIEILGAKMLAPYFGTSHFVWTAQIVVTMVALALGYYLGGRLADRAPRLGLLYGALVMAALYLCLATRFCVSISYFCLKFPLAPGSLLASLALYFPPLTLLAMTGPFFTRVLSVSVQSVGTLAGKISSIGTIGSVLGTVLIGYVLIPLLPNSSIMNVTAAVLAVVAAVYWQGWGRGGVGQGAGFAGVFLVGLLVMIGGAKGEPLTYGEELYRGNSNFGLMQVVQSENGRHRYYLNDFLSQNSYDPVVKKSLSLFSYMLQGLAKGYYETASSTNVPAAPARRIERVLCIGLGVGMAPMAFARDGATVDVVEINPAVVAVGQRFFDLEPARLHLYLGDGRAYLNRLQPGYDAIALDAFLGDASPGHLMSQEAFAAMRRLLKPEGVLVINSFGNFTAGRDYFCGSLHRTLKSVFGQVIIHDGANGNVFFVALPSAANATLRVPTLDHVHPACLQKVQDTFARVVPPPEAGIVLTDDFNPADFHDAANRERLRRNLAMSMVP